MKRKIKNSQRNVFKIVFIILVALLFSNGVMAQPIPKVTIGIDQANKPGEVAVTLQILLFLTVLSLAPALMIMVTSFTRIAIVFSFLRHALATQQAPPTQVMIGLAIFLTIFVMTPVWTEINDQALKPYLSNEISQKEAYEKAINPVRTFMFKQTGEKELSLFMNMANLAKPENRDDIPTHVLIPAFITSEFRIAFQIGFLIYVPFLMLDMIIASVLLSMGMMMLPPIMISLPCKLLLFVLVDGWYLIIGSLVAGFQ